MKTSRRRIGFFAAAGIGFLVLIPTLANYQRIVWEQVTYDRFGRGSILLTAYMAVGGLYEAASMSVKSMVTLFTTHQVRDASPLADIHLRISDGSMRALMSNLPESGKSQYFKAELKYPDGRWRPIKYRLRGASSFHHQIDKPSIRIKLKRSNPIGLLRHINLINPEDRPMLANILADDIAHDIGVMAHLSRMVRVFINGEYRGVYQMQTREDEEMLRASQRVPGPLFIGNNLKDQWDAGDFEYAGETKGLEPLGLNPLNEMIKAIYGERRIDRVEKLRSVLDFDKYARYSAVVTLVGSWHIDAHHNQGFYFDPSRGMIEPMLLDANGHGMTTYPATWRRFVRPWKPDYSSPLNGLNHPLLDVVLQDPRFQHSRNTYLWQLLRGPGSIKSQHARMNAYYDMMDPDVYADANKGGLYRSFVGYTRFPYTNGEYDDAKKDMYEWIEKRNALLDNELKLSSVSVIVGPSSANGTQIIEISVDGNSAAQFNTSTFAGRLLADRNLDGTPEDDVRDRELLYPGLRADAEYEYKEQSFGKPLPKRTLFAAPQRYLFSYTGNEDVEALVKLAFSNDVTGETISPVVRFTDTLDTKLIEYNDFSIHAWSLQKLPADITPLVLGPGTVTLTETLTVSESESLTVVPGTTLLLGPGVSLVSRGKLNMEGTPGQPIIVSRLDPSSAWGAMLIIGAKSKGSRIDHANISGGSIAQFGALLMTGMVNVHWTTDFSLTNSDIGWNLVSDDTLHVIHSSADLENVNFARCNGDCIDFDFAEGSVHGLTVVNSGNDGVDFMESRITLSDINISGSGDKGFSVGEGSHIQANGGAIGRSEIGIAVKDSSTLDLRNWQLKNNKTAIDVYRKNWRYAMPGSAEIRSTTFDGNDLDVRVVKNGFVTIYGNQLPRNVESEGQVLLKRPDHEVSSLVPSSDSPADISR